MSKGSLLDRIGGLLGFETAEKKRKSAFTAKATELVQEAKAFNVKLVPLEQKELELLSMKFDVLQKSRNRRAKILKFSNIYHEPLYVSVEEKVSRSSQDVALKIFSKQSVYTYWLRPDYVSIWNGSTFWGNLHPDGRFVYKNNKVVGQIITNGNSERLEIHVSGKLQIAIDLSETKVKASTRAFSYVHFSSDSAFELGQILSMFVLTNPESNFNLSL